MTDKRRPTPSIPCGGCYLNIVKGVICALPSGTFICEECLEYAQKHKREINLNRKKSDSKK